MGYAALTDITARLSAGDFDDAVVTARLAIAESRVNLFMELADCFTKRSSHTITERRVRNGHRLYLQSTFLPIITLISVTVNSTLQTLSQFSYDDLGHYVYWDTYEFAEGDEVVIVADVGWATPPLDVKEATIRLSLLMLYDDEEMRMGGPEKISAITTEGAEVQYSIQTAPTLSTGDSWADAVLWKYKKRLIVMGRT